MLKNDEFMAISVANPWFTRTSVEHSFQGWSKALREAAVAQWLKGYAPVQQPKTVGIIMAGNIPLVGLHDLLSVLVSGHLAKIKCASDDPLLVHRVVQLITEISPETGTRISFTEKMTAVDALIATGSNNSARYFEYYFNHIPHIIRKNRNSTAVLTGNESKTDLGALGRDVFDYFGLGCRNVNHLFVPQGYDFNPLFEAWEGFRPALMQHSKYFNNFEYQLAMLLINRTPHLTNNAVILRESDAFNAAVSVLHYTTYAHRQEVLNLLETHQDQLQCVVSAASWIPSSIPFGQSQVPELWDYADGINTLEFLQRI
jgi:hypothetical protein